MLSQLNYHGLSWLFYLSFYIKVIQSQKSDSESAHHRTSSQWQDSLALCLPFWSCWMAILDGYMGAKFILLTWSLQNAVVAEWLRRLTRNQFRSAGVGSNPTDREYFLVGAKFFCIYALGWVLQRLLHAPNLYQLLLCSFWSNIRERHWFYQVRVDFVASVIFFCFNASGVDPRSSKRASLVQW